jgi:hypothetical protein
MKWVNAGIQKERHPAEFDSISGKRSKEKHG